MNPIEPANHLPTKRGEFDKNLTPVAVFLLVVAGIPLVAFRVIRPVLGNILGLNMTQVWPRIIGTILGGVLLLLLAVWIFRWERISPERIGCSWQHIVWGVGWFSGIITIVNGLLFVAAVAVADGYEFATAGVTPGVWIGLAIANWIFVGFAEELVARAYLQNKLIAVLDGENHLLRRASGIFIAALLFAVWHVPQRLWVAGLPLGQLPENLGQLLLLAVIFGAIYEITRNVVLVALVHGAWDFPPIFLSVFTTQTWQGIILLLAILAPFIIGIALYWRLAVRASGPQVPS